MSGTLLFNPTPRAIVGMYGGVEIVIPPNSKYRCRSIRKNPESVYHGEEIAEKLAGDHSGEGLLLLDEDNPIPTDALRRVGCGVLAKTIRMVIRDFNALNQKQASQNLPILFPSDEMRELQALLPKLESRPEEFVGEEELGRIAKKETVNQMALLMRIAAAVESGDMEAVRAAMPKDYIRHVAEAGGFKTGPAPAARAIDEPSDADLNEEVPDLADAANAPNPEDLATAADMPAPVAAPTDEELETGFVTPKAQLGKGPQAVPPQARRGRKR